MAPILRHLNQRYLIRHLVDSHPPLRGASTAALGMMLSPAIAMALWITRYAPDLACCERLNIALAAKTPSDASDAGRWFQFVPWLLGKPKMTVSVQLMVKDPNSLRWSPFAELAVSGLHRHVRHLEGAGVELQSICRVQDPEQYSLFVLSHPNFANEHEHWFGADGLGAILHTGKPVAALAYSNVEYELDRAAANAYGVHPTNDGSPNPFADEPDGWRGSYAAWLWDLTGCSVPPDAKHDASLIKDIEAVENLMGASVHELGDAAITALGQTIQPKDVPLVSDEAKPIVLLPDSHALDLNDGAVYAWDGLTNTVRGLEPPLSVPMATCEAFPGDQHLFRRWVWAVRLFEQHVMTKADEPVRADEPVALNVTPEVAKEVTDVFIATGFDPERAEQLTMYMRGARQEVSAEAARIHALVHEGKTQQVLDLLRSKPSLASCVDAEGDPLVVAAATRSNAEVVAKCIALGADVNASALDGFTPLHLAAREGHREIARLLLQAGADPTTRTAMGWTAARLAKQRGHFRMAQLLSRYTRNAAGSNAA